jgi:hypothetical protein
MKKIFLIVLCVLCSGCAVISSAPSIFNPGKTANPEQMVQKGMSRQQVSSIMDKVVTVGFDIDPTTGISRPIETKSLFSSEIMMIKGQSCQVDRYIIRSNNGLAVTSEDALFPVVYEKGVVIAKGWGEFELLKKK